MNLPQSLFIQTIEARNIHLDVHSHEKGTGVVKRKYKLAGNRFPGGGMLFWVSTHKSNVYSIHKTVKYTYPDDYEECTAKPLKDTPAYLSIDHIDYLSDDEIYTKYSNPDNGFKKVGKIKVDAFKKLTSLTTKLKLTPDPNSLQQMINITRATVGSEENVDDILKSMGLPT